MNNFNETIKEIKKISMSAEEKSRMRAQISMFVAKHPVGTPIRSPWQMNNLLEGAIFLTLGLFVGVSGLTFFAAKANPGDALYPLKSVLIKPISIENPSPAQTRTENPLQNTPTQLSVPHDVPSQQTPSPDTSGDMNQHPAPIVTPHTLSGTITVTNVCEAAHKGPCPTYIFANTSASIRASNGTITSVVINQGGNFDTVLADGSYTIILPPIGNIRTNTEKLVILSKDTSVSFNFTNTVQ